MESDVPKETCIRWRSRFRTRNDMPGILDDTVVSCPNTAEPIEMPFRLWAWMGSKTRVLDGS